MQTRDDETRGGRGCRTESNDFSPALLETRLRFVSKGNFVSREEEVDRHVRWTRNESGRQIPILCVEHCDVRFSSNWYNRCNFGQDSLLPPYVCKNPLLFFLDFSIRETKSNNWNNQKWRIFGSPGVDTLIRDLSFYQ